MTAGNKIQFHSAHPKRKPISTKFCLLRFFVKWNRLKGRELKIWKVNK